MKNRQEGAVENWRGREENNRTGVFPSGDLLILSHVLNLCCRLIYRQFALILHISNLILKPTRYSKGTVGTHQMLAVSVMQIVD